MLFRSNPDRFEEGEVAGATAPAVQKLFDAGARFVGTHLKGSVDYREPDYRKGPLVLVMGNEQQGLPETLAKACDVLIRIPQAGRADSLNLAVATGVTLYEMRRHALAPTHEDTV